MASQPICIDCYPYTAGSTSCPPTGRLVVPRHRQLVQIAAQYGAGPGSHREMLGVSEEEAIRRLSPAGGIYFRLDEADVRPS